MYLESYKTVISSLSVHLNTSTIWVPYTLQTRQWGMKHFRRERKIAGGFGNSISYVSPPKASRPKCWQQLFPVLRMATCRSIYPWLSSQRPVAGVMFRWVTLLETWTKIFWEAVDTKTTEVRQEKRFGIANGRSHKLYIGPYMTDHPLKESMHEKSRTLSHPLPNVDEE